MGGWSAPRPGRFIPGKDPVPIVQEAGLAPGPIWTGVENLALTGIRSPNRPSLSQPLYRLNYPTHNIFYTVLYIFNAQTGKIYVLLNLYLRKLGLLGFNLRVAV
jgi:hypothetical protein